MKDTFILFGKTPHQLLMSFELDKNFSSRIPFSIFIVINIPSIHIMIDPEFNTCPGMKVYPVIMLCNGQRFPTRYV